jgi:heat shock protein HslJ
MKKIFTLFLSAIIFSACATSPTPKHHEPLSNFYGEAWQFYGFQETENGVDITRRADTNATFTIVFKSDGTIGGKAHCNSYFGSYAIEDEQLALLNIGSTKMHCGDNSGDQEFLRALGNTRRFELFRSEAVTPDKYRLVLYHLENLALVFLKDTL